MKIAGIDFPKPLLNALRNDELVVFAGAGVSMGKPANLPDFTKLAKAIGHGTTEDLQVDEPEDSYLGRLHQKHVKVHERAAQELAKHNPKPTSLHYDLLRLYPDSPSARVVTTNFDLLFEKAARSVFTSDPEVFKAPALPLGRTFNGIVHIHGAISRPTEMVLTDADFGRAYLIEGWARRFLVDLFRSFTVLFVGYSHDDIVMRYLARGLPPSETKPRFALAGKDDESRWIALNITPVTYPRSPGDSHDSLYVGVQRLAEYATRGILDWKREITEIAHKSPQLNEEEIGLILEALSNPTLTRFFTDSASHVEWINWLEDRKLLDKLFGTEALQPQDRRLAMWLADRFSLSFPNRVFLLIASHEMQLHPDLWWALSHTVSQDRDHPMDADVLSRWVSILLATTTPSLDHQYRLSHISERCVEAGLIDPVIEIFDAMISSRLVLKQGFDWLNASTDDSNPPIDVEVDAANDHYMLDSVWKSGLRLYLDKVAEPLLGRVIYRLEVQHQTYQAWQEANREWDPTSYRRSAIEPHDQNRHPDATDVLIDAARDCLEWLASEHSSAAAGWCERLIRSEAPILRRLAVHVLPQRTDLSADDKVDWVLGSIGLHDVAAHHETYQIMRRIYPETSLQQRRAVIDSVHAYRWPDAKDKEYKRRTAFNHFRWINWLHDSYPECVLSAQALDVILKQHPDFSAGDHPDFLSWSGEVTEWIPESPWSPEELVSQPAKDRLADLLTFHPPSFDGPSREGLLRAIERAATLKFDWGLGLADDLAASGHWRADIWPPLMRAWHRELDESKHAAVLRRLMWPALYPRHTRLSAEVLHSLVKQGGMPYAPELIPEANRLALHLWNQIDSDEEIIERQDWLTTSINHSAGVLALFWVGSLSIWMNQQGTKAKGIPDDYRAALSTIIQATSLAGRLGRSVFAWYFSLLFSYDSDWIEDTFLPLFDQRNINDDYRALWDGLTSGRLSPAAAEAMGDAFLNALPNIKTAFSGEERLRSFIQSFTAMLVYIVDDPLSEWIPSFFEHSDSDSRSYFAAEIGHFLDNLDDAKQRELWTRWLHRFWENRLQGVPAQLIDEEVAEMIAWTPRFSSLFSNAVDLAIEMHINEPTHGRHFWISLHRVQKNKTWNTDPEATAKFLLYLKPFLLSYHSPDKIKELIDNLQKMKLSPETDHALIELYNELP